MILSALGQLTTFLTTNVDGSVLSQKIPFTNQTVGSVINGAGAFVNGFINGLNTAVNGSGAGAGTAGTIQAFIDEVGSLLHIDTSGLKVNYDPTTETTTFNVNISYPFSTSTSLNLSGNLGPLGSISTSSTLSLNANAGISFTFGFTNDHDAALTPTDADVPPDGILDGDAHFELEVGTDTSDQGDSSDAEPLAGAAPVSITLPMPIALTGVPAWAAAGPAPIQGAAVTQPGALALTGNGNPEIGAINQIAVVPGLPNSIYVASVNGGVWHTSNGTSPSPTWTPLTDAYPSLSVSALAVSPLDATGNTVFAGIGKVSSAGQYGGPQVGVMRTTNGGKTWSVIGGGADRSAGECGTAHKRVRRRGRSACAGRHDEQWTLPQSERQPVGVLCH